MSRNVKTTLESFGKNQVAADVDASIEEIDIADDFADFGREYSTEERFSTRRSSDAEIPIGTFQEILDAEANAVRDSFARESARTLERLENRLLKVGISMEVAMEELRNENSSLQRQLQQGVRPLSLDEGRVPMHPRRPSVDVSTSEAVSPPSGRPEEVPMIFPAAKHWEAPKADDISEMAADASPAYSARHLGNCWNSTEGRELTVVAQAEEQCVVCGNIFMKDAIFCRKCGSERAMMSEGYLKTRANDSPREQSKDGILQMKSEPAASSAQVFGLGGMSARFRENDKKHKGGRNMASAGHTTATVTTRTTMVMAAVQFHRGTAKDELTSPIKHNWLVDKDLMKEMVRDAVMTEEYNVSDFYKPEGMMQAIATHQAFENLTLLVISLNAIWISVDIDYNKAAVLKDAEVHYIVAENFFCVYFAIELAIRYAAFWRKRDCFRDSWFVFDLFLVVIMVLETWVLQIVLMLTEPVNNNEADALGGATIFRLVRFLKLARMARMAGLLRMMPEMMILIKAVTVAIRSVFFTLCLLLVVIYVFAITFTQLAQGSDVEHTFPNVPASMTFLMLQGMVPDIVDTVYEMGDQDMAFACLFMFFIFLSTLTLMNMLVGVLVEVVSGASSAEKEHLTVQFVKSQLQEIMNNSGFDENGDNMVSKQEFGNLITNAKAARLIQDVGVDVIGLVEFSDFIFKDNQELTFFEFMDLILQLRGSNTATVRDIVDMRKFIYSEMQSLRSQIQGHLRDTVTSLKKSNTRVLSG